jgi:hypothetical protein
MTPTQAIPLLMDKTHTHTYIHTTTQAAALLTHRTQRTPSLGCKIQRSTRQSLLHNIAQHHYIITHIILQHKSHSTTTLSHISSRKDHHTAPLRHISPHSGYHTACPPVCLSINLPVYPPSCISLWSVTSLQLLNGLLMQVAPRPSLYPGRAPFPPRPPPPLVPWGACEWGPPQIVAPRSRASGRPYL